MKVAALFAGLLLCFTSLRSQSVIISEVTDPSDAYQARYVEIHNPTSSAVDISNWEIRRYANGNTTSCDATIPSSTSLASGATYTIAYDATTFNNEFSCSPDQESGCITGNGDDTYELVDDGGTVIDIYGEVGVDGTGESWEYEDAVAERNADVCSGNSTWTSSEWTITDPGNTGDATPCSHNSNCGCSHSISSFTPTEGCPDTGTVTVTISGSGFNNGSGTSDVQFNGTSSPSFTVISDSEIEAEVPSGGSTGPISVVTDGCTEKSSSDFTYTCNSCYQLFVNEFSNGESGSREYTELIVGNSCGGCSADLGGWIIDDNNGDFSGGPNSGEGIAGGHVRFSSNGTWDDIPAGSIILIYNDADENLTIKNEPVSDDPTDSDNDSVYVIPISNSNLEECTSVPNSSDASYSGCSYSSPASWDPISMANSDDAMQTRKPDGSYFHGACYGSNSDFDGGPDNLHVHNSGGSGDCFYFGGSDPRDVGNWSQGAATSSLSTTDETPASANNASNETYIDNLVCSTLPIELLLFEGEALEKANRLRWRTGSEIHQDRFELQRSRNAEDFRTIGRVQGKGGQGGGSTYQFLDEEAPELAYYRLRSVDMDGDTEYSRTIVLQRRPSGAGMEIRKMGNAYKLILPSAYPEKKVQILDAMGRKVKTLHVSGTSKFRFEMNDKAEGLYFLRYRTRKGGSMVRKFFH